MASWFRQVEDFLETVDRTAATVAVVRDKAKSGDYPESAGSSDKSNPVSGSLEKAVANALPETDDRILLASRNASHNFLHRGHPLDESSESSSTNAPHGFSVKTDSTVQNVNVLRSLATEIEPMRAVNIGNADGKMVIDERVTEEGRDTEDCQASGNCLKLSDNNNPSAPSVNMDANGRREGSTNGVKAISQEEFEMDKKPVENMKPGEVLTAYAESAGSHQVTDSQSQMSEEGEDKNYQVSKSITLQNDLDEARGLLKNSSSEGKSKEARLARICASLSQRLQEYKAENGQLEELLSSERNLRLDLESHMALLQQQVSQSQASLLAVEASAASALAAKNTELESLASKWGETKRQMAELEVQLAALQTSTEVISKTRDMSEARMIQALREELDASERRFEEERASHAATRMSAAEREIDLEQRITESAAGLTRMQRLVDERTQRAGELEDRISVLELECTGLNQELLSMEAKLKREQKRSTDETSVAAQVHVWREEVERALRAQREVESKLKIMEAEKQKLHVELESTKREAEKISSHAQADLEKRFRELTELLYLKQTQLEAMSSEKQAAVLQLEKESRKLRELKSQTERERVTRRNVAAMDDDDRGLRSFESLDLQQRRIVGPRIQQAAKLLDEGAVTAGRFLWRRPLARLALLFYLVFVHLFLMYLLHRLQEQADDLLSRDRASMAAEQAAGLVLPGRSSHQGT